MNKIEQTRRRLIKAGRKIINLSSGNPNEFGIFFDRAILESACKKFLRAPAYEPDPKGALPARKAVARFYADRGLKVDPEQIILTSGSSESYFHIFKMLAKPGEKVLFPKPSYPLFDEIARLAEVETGFYNLDPDDGWQVDCDNLESKLRDDVKAIVLISPSNPTGAVLSEQTLRRVAEIAARHGVAVISDEVFSEYVFDDVRFPRMAEIAQRAGARIAAGRGKIAKRGNGNPTVYTLNGFSKTYALPGLKLSWVVVTGPDQHQVLTSSVGATSSVEKLERSADAFLATNQIAQAMAPDIIKKGAPFIAKLRERLQKNRDLAIKILGANPHITFHIPEGGFYIFARVGGQSGSWLRTIGTKGSRPGRRQFTACPPQFLTEDGFRPAARLTDEDFVIALMEKTGIFVHPGYFYDYDKGVNILISLLPPQKVLKQKLERIVNSTPYPSRASSRRSRAR